MSILDPIPAREFPGKVYDSHFTNEPMVSVADFFESSIFIEPVYYNRHIAGAVKDMYLRETTAMCLKRALYKLPEGMTFKIYDAWRPVSVQQGLFDEYYGKLRKEHPDWPEEHLLEKTLEFVSLPSTNPDCPSAHNTGGAVDLTLVWRENGSELNMGTAFDDFTERANTCYYESNALSPEDVEVRNNRRLLYWTMVSAGFTNLPTEWWHFDYGDAFWAYYAKKPSIYRGKL